VGFFGRLRRKISRSRKDEFSDLLEDRGPLSLGGTLKSLMAQDAESIARGEIPERRLIPHHAIKRDVIVAAYEKDFRVAIDQVKSLNWVEEEKTRRIFEMRVDFDKHVFGVKRLSWQDLDKIIALMKKTRTDLKEIEQDIRSKNPIYGIVDPL
jgi:hypothetical protein